MQECWKALDARGMRKRASRGWRFALAHGRRVSAAGRAAQYGANGVLLALKAVTLTVGAPYVPLPPAWHWIVAVAPGRM